MRSGLNKWSDLLWGPVRTRCPACAGPADYVGLNTVEGCTTRGCVHYDTVADRRKMLESMIWPVTFD